jgi:hypothetical protein
MTEIAESRLNSQSGRPDSNRGPPVPQTGALTRLRHAPWATESSGYPPSSSARARGTAHWQRWSSAPIPRSGSALQVRGLDEDGHQIAFPLALRPALGIFVEHGEILIVVAMLFHAFFIEAKPA